MKIQLPLAGRRLLYIAVLFLLVQQTTVAQQTTLPVETTGVSAIEKIDSTRLTELFELLSFTGLGGNGQNTLSWKTDSRSHFTGFTVERSPNETEFTAIGHIESSGTPATNSFTYADNNPLAGRSFYRLQMSDSSGRKEYSVVISVTNIPATNLQIQYDAASGTVGLAGMATGISYQLKVYNSSGQLMLQKPVSTASATISISQLPHGLYVVNTTDGAASTQSRKVIW